MSKLSFFLHPAIPQETQEVVVSNRFQDEDGNPVPFKIRALSQEENEQIAKMSRKAKKVSGQLQERLDSAEFSRRMVVAATVEPDFSSTEMCNAYGVIDPLMVPGKMLLAGEFTRLLQAITDLSGFESPDDEIKN